MFWLILLFWFGQNEPQPQPRDPPPTTEQIATFVDKAYQQLPAIHFTATVVTPERSLWCDIHHRAVGPNVLRVYETTNNTKEVIYDLRTLGLVNQENFWLSEENYRTGQVVQYNLPTKNFYDYQTWDPRLIDGLGGCDFAAYYWSWVGTTSPRREIFRSAIAGGTYLGKETVEQQTCWVIRDGTEAANQKFFVNTENHLIVRWTKELGGKTVKDRRFNTKE